MFSGCLGAETHLTIKNDGTGTLEISYRVSKLVAYLGAESESHRHVILPVREEDLASFADDIEGVDLSRHTFRENDTDILVTARFQFNSLDAIASMFRRLDGPTLTVVQGEDGTTTLSWLLYRGLVEPAGENVKQMVESFFADYSIEWRVSVPSEISYVSDGATDGATALISKNTTDLLLTVEPVTWEIQY